MKEVAQSALDYLRENLVATLAIAIIAGFTATKTVAYGRKANPALYFIVGILGAFLGQFAILYFGIKEILDALPEFRFFFDLLAAYMGSFIVASLIHFVKPN